MPAVFKSEETFQLIKDLTELQATSGNERNVRNYLKDHMTDLVDSIHLSPLGNIMGVKKSKNPDAPILMVAAHMDEVGFMVRRINDRGLIEVVALGGWNPYVVSAQRYTLQTAKGDYPIVSGAVPPHLLRNKEGKTEVKVEQIVFDAGFSSKEEAESYGVRPGDTIVPQVETVMTANQKSVLCKAWDNRYGCVVVLETLQAIKDLELDYNLVIGATVQEEVGLRGIRGAINEFKPELFLAVDCSPANDMDQAHPGEGSLNEGFLLRTQDPGMITATSWLHYIEDLAIQESIKYQSFFSQGGTDAGAAHTLNDGVPSAVIGVPARYIHGHQTLFTLEDYHAARAMVYQIVTDLSADKIRSMRQG